MNPLRYFSPLTWMVYLHGVEEEEKLVKRTFKMLDGFGVRHSRAGGYDPFVWRGLQASLSVLHLSLLSICFSVMIMPSSSPIHLGRALCKEFQLDLISSLCVVDEFVPRPFATRTKMSRESHEGRGKMTIDGTSDEHQHLDQDYFLAGLTSIA